MGQRWRRCAVVLAAALATTLVGASAAVDAASVSAAPLPAGSYTAFVANPSASSVTPIGANNTAGSPIIVGAFASAVAVTGNTAYVANENTANVSVIDTTTNTVTHTVMVGG